MEGFPAGAARTLPPSCKEAVNQPQLPAKSLHRLEAWISELSPYRVSPDLAMCSYCRQEIMDPQNRRYMYPFTACADCGPRFTAADASSSRFSSFHFCPDCQRENLDPADRRFKSSNLTCPRCGPRIKLLDSCGRQVPGDWRTPVRRALTEGKIIAIKGIGGYHLACDAYNTEAINRLRANKHRPDKPLAVMARDLNCLQRWFLLSGREREVLLGPEAPIVLLKFQQDPGSSGSWARVAPGLRRTGVMLPYSPLHLSLFDQHLEFLVMTSGNLSGQPLVYADPEALLTLIPMADYLLTHDRTINRPCDDSVVILNDQRLEFVRRSKGYIPRALPIPLPERYPKVELLGAGADFKNTFCLYKDGQAVMSQHIGDLSSEEMAGRYVAQIDDLQQLLQIFPEVGICDLHPEYVSSKALAAGKGNKPCKYELLKVQHHHAHLASCMADNQLTGRAVGIIADGTGYGLDGHLWGFEILVGDYLEFSREAHLEYIPLPGGEACINFPRRIAMSYLKRYEGPSWIRSARKLFSGQDQEIEIISRILDSGFNCPLSSGCGRLFDAVSAMLGICTASSYDGQAAAELGSLVDGVTQPLDYDYRFTIADGLISPRQVITCILRDLELRLPVEIIALKFHDALAEIMAGAARAAAQKYCLERIVLSGGVFQNQYLSRRCTEILESCGLKVYTHSRVPCNDGGIALGQVAIGLWRLANGGVDSCV